MQVLHKMTYSNWNTNKRNHGRNEVR